MELVALDRFMRRGQATVRISLLFAVSTTVAFVVTKWLHNPMHVLSTYEVAGLSGLALLTTGFSALGVLSWRHLWRSGRTPAEVIVYDFGVRQLGIGIVLLSPLFVFLLLLALSADIARVSWWALIPLSIVMIAMMLPLGLWLEYILGLPEGEQLNFATWRHR